jgi:hypothetical protein
MTKKAPASTHRSEAHAKIAEREALIYEANHLQGQDAVLNALRADRRARWAALLEGREESAGIREWATNMETLHGGGVVEIWKNPVPWITALYVARYGEAEDNWPPALTEGDLVRANKWLRGGVPEGIGRVHKEG